MKTLSKISAAIGSILTLCSTATLAESPIDTLQKGVPVIVAGDRDQEYRNYYPLRELAEELTFTISGGVGDPDLYARKDLPPQKATYDCRPYVSGQNEKCTFRDAIPGDYHVMVLGYSAFSGSTLIADHIPATNIPTNVINVAQGQFEYLEFDLPQGLYELEVSISGGTGDADLYLRYGAKPTLSNFDCRPYRYGNNESCYVGTPQAGTYHVGVYGYTAASDVNYSFTFN